MRFYRAIIRPSEQTSGTINLLTTSECKLNYRNFSLFYSPLQSLEDKRVGRASERTTVDGFDDSRDVFLAVSRIAQ